MNKKLILSLLALAGVPALMMAADDARLLRFPATNGNEIVFSYAGDLYKVPAKGGEAQRLTSHVGYEMFPRFSPDGKTIAFTGQYDGNTEVFTIPSTGGEPLRVTYTATNARDDLGDRMGPNNIVIAWTPDGSRIVYRNRISSGFDGKLYTVDKEGGLSEVIPLPEGGFCSYSPDGKQLAYNRVMREFRTWKYYKGGMADDIWIYNPEKKSVENITDNVAQDIIPMWIDDEIFFLAFIKIHSLTFQVANADLSWNLIIGIIKDWLPAYVLPDEHIRFGTHDRRCIYFCFNAYFYIFPVRFRMERNFYNQLSFCLCWRHIVGYICKDRTDPLNDLPCKVSMCELFKIHVPAFPCRLRSGMPFRLHILYAEAIHIPGCFQNPAIGLLRSPVLRPHDQ